MRPEKFFPAAGAPGLQERRRTATKNVIAAERSEPGLTRRPVDVCQPVRGGQAARTHPGGSHGWTGEAAALGTAQILIGTSGYSYKDWVGPFYPTGLPERDMLAYYAREFPFVEINFSYYRLPAQRTLAGMARKVPEGFLFTVKAYQNLTHGRGETVAEDASKFLHGIAPLLGEGRLGAVLLQFPYSFHNTEENHNYLVRLKGLLPGVPLVVEFRNRGWAREPVWELLSSLGMGYVCVDEPGLRGLIGGVVKCTAPVAYVRFHGRNAAKWWEHEAAHERYDYLYGEDELKERVPGIAGLASRAERVFVAFNNHYQAKAVVNARMLRRMLEEAGLL